MSTVNFNDTTPAPVPSTTNVKWQSDASGNISAYYAPPGWLNWNPAITASGSMTVSSPTITFAQYFQLGQQVFINVNAAFTLGGTADNAVILTIPVTAVQVNDILACMFQPAGGAWQPTVCYVDWQTNRLRLNMPTVGTNFPLGATQFLATGYYRA